MKPLTYAEIVQGKTPLQKVLDEAGITLPDYIKETINRFRRLVALAFFLSGMFLMLSIVYLSSLLIGFLILSGLLIISYYSLRNK